MANIKRIKLSNGSVYSIFDEGALRLNEAGKLVTGNTIVDQIILEGNLYISEVDDVPVDDTIDNVVTMVRDENGYYTLKKRSTDKLLADIGGTSHEVNGAVLSLHIGK
jgi:hypothetical protein